MFLWGGVIGLFLFYYEFCILILYFSIVNMGSSEEGWYTNLLNSNTRFFGVNQTGFDFCYYLLVNLQQVGRFALKDLA